MSLKNDNKVQMFLPFEKFLGGNRSLLFSHGFSLSPPPCTRILVVMNLPKKRQNKEDLTD